jgi:hypothetical protein
MGAARQELAPALPPGSISAPDFRINTAQNFSGHLMAGCGSIV